MKNKIRPLYILFPVLLAFSFTSLLMEPVRVKDVTAVKDAETDMSKVSILSNESFDTSHIIYDDFSGVSLDNNWVVSHRKWGGFDNKGVSADNVFIDTENDKVIIRALGNQHMETPTVDGVGGPVSAGALVLKEAARPGRYEVKMKVAYQVGVCNAMWTYTEDSAGQNHEIDIEFPFKDDRGNNAFNEVIFTNYIGESNYQQTHKTLDYYLNDGEYHTFAFDWYYSSRNKVIRYYIDTVLIATHYTTSKMPFLPSRLWLGCWIPNNPGFVGLPNFDQCFMEIDYFKYSPFLDQESVTKGQAGGCGNTSTEYHVINHGFDKYDWMSNGSFPGMNKSNSLTDRGFEVSGSALLAQGFDHTGTVNSGAVKLGQNASISYSVDSTYKGYKYKLITYYKGAGRAQFMFFSESNYLLDTLQVVMPTKNNWSLIEYNFEVPTNAFYTVLKFESQSSEYYLDDISMVLDKNNPIFDVILVGITLSGPSKTTYQIGEELDLTGLVVTGIYSDGSSQTITDYQVSEVDMNTSGDKFVTITVDNQTASFTITVDESGHSSVTLTSISIEGSYRTKYTVGDTLDLNGLVVRGFYSNGTSKEITNYQVSSVDMSTSGIKRVTITYIDKMEYFEITIYDKTSSLGCGGNVVTTSVLLCALSIVGIALLTYKKKHC